MPDFLLSVLSSPYFIGSVFVIYGAFFVYTKLLPNARRAKLALSSYRMAKGSTLTPERLRLVALSAVNAEQWSAYHNTLSLGKELKEHAEGFLTQGYGVDSPRAAREAIEGRLSGQFSSMLPIIFGAFQLDIARRKDFLHEAAGDDRDLYNYLMDKVDHLIANLPTLEKKGVVSGQNDIMKYSLIGWEIGQASMLVRASYDLGHISEEEAWGYLEQAQKLARKNFNSWEEYGMSYLVGRAIQLKDGAEDMPVFVFDLLKNQKSPWLSCGW
ncbi:MAG: hypothetical protein CSA07_05555 [Bacteroidia bacterium]|nr:MAG: hypothetical protein CSA07_05555 [Bacteroidia bacterium]